jgi:hypothetical protein
MSLKAVAPSYYCFGSQKLTCALYVFVDDVPDPYYSYRPNPSPNIRTDNLNISNTTTKIIRTPTTFTRTLLTPHLTNTRNRKKLHVGASFPITGTRKRSSWMKVGVGGC